MNENAFNCQRKTRNDFRLGNLPMPTVFLRSLSYSHHTLYFIIDIINFEKEHYKMLLSRRGRIKQFLFTHGLSPPPFTVLPPQKKHTYTKI